MITDIKYFTELPLEAKSLICLETNSEFLWSGYRFPTRWTREFYQQCSNCKKPHIEYLWQCHVCDTYFVKNFRHPSWCMKFPYCYSCLEQYPEDTCKCSFRKCCWWKPENISPPMHTTYKLPDNFNIFNYNII